MNPLNGKPPLDVFTAAPAPFDPLPLAAVLLEAVAAYWADRKAGGHVDDESTQGGGSVAALALVVGEVCAVHKDPKAALKTFTDAVSHMQDAGAVGRYYAERRRKVPIGQSRCLHCDAVFLTITGACPECFQKAPT